MAQQEILRYLKDRYYIDDSKRYYGAVEIAKALDMPAIPVCLQARKLHRFGYLDMAVISTNKRLFRYNPKEKKGTVEFKKPFKKTEVLIL